MCVGFAIEDSYNLFSTLLGNPYFLFIGTAFCQCGLAKVFRLCSHGNPYFLFIGRPFFQCDLAKVFRLVSSFGNHYYLFIGTAFCQCGLAKVFGLLSSCGDRVYCCWYKAAGSMEITKFLNKPVFVLIFSVR